LIAISQEEKAMKKTRITLGFVTVLVLAMLTTDAIAATLSPKSINVSSMEKSSVLQSIKINTPIATVNSNELNTKNSVISISTESTFGSNSDLDLPTEIPEEAEELKEIVPATVAEAEANVVPLRNRFLMWTHDLEHVMWGYYRNGFFIGTDNQGKLAWGVYGNGFFAGLYDGEFFWGKYRDGRWRARYLFGEEKVTHGGYVVAPTIVAARYLEILPEAQVSARQMRIAEAATESQVSTAPEMPEEVEIMRENLPSLDEAEVAVQPFRNRFLMWTRDLKNIMWGHCGNRYFVGTDNQQKRAWGIYGKGVFAGKYDGEFFWGFYRNGCWRAFDLFGKPLTFGRYLTAT
jgi:hypothetical protein